MHEIAAASQEQSTGIEQVNGAVVQMDQMTQENAALVEEASAASALMGQQANRLQQLVNYFRTTDESTTYDGVDRRSSERPWSHSA